MGLEPVAEGETEHSSVRRERAGTDARPGARFEGELCARAGEIHSERGSIPPPPPNQSGPNRPVLVFTCPSFSRYLRSVRGVPPVR